MSAPGLDLVRTRQPLVLNITNYVVMNTTANALLAVGASPIMAHAAEEIEELAAMADAVVVNIGTLSPPWVEAMRRAGSTAARRGIPLVLDPVGSGATAYRTRTARTLLRDARPAIVRGNASEVRSLVAGDSGTRGVDSGLSPQQVAEDAWRLAREFGCVVCVSGAEDLIVGDGAQARVANGDPMMARVTGMGCTASALIGAFVAAATGSPFDAARNAMVAIGVAGELAARQSAGPGSFQVALIDALAVLDDATLAARQKLR